MQHNTNVTTTDPNKHTRKNTHESEDRGPESARQAARNSDDARNPHADSNHNAFVWPTAAAPRRTVHTKGIRHAARAVLPIRHALRRETPEPQLLIPEAQPATRDRTRATARIVRRSAAVVVVQADSINLHARGQSSAGGGTVVIGAYRGRERAVGEGGVVRFFGGRALDEGGGRGVAGPVGDRELESLTCAWFVFRGLKLGKGRGRPRRRGGQGETEKEREGGREGCETLSRVNTQHQTGRIPSHRTHSQDALSSRTKHTGTLNAQHRHPHRTLVLLVATFFCFVVYRIFLPPALPWRVTTCPIPCPRLKTKAMS